MVTKVISEPWNTKAGDDGPGSNRVQADRKPCKQYNEKIVTPHLN